MSGKQEVVASDCRQCKDHYDDDRAYRATKVVRSYLYVHIFVISLLEAVALR